MKLNIINSNKNLNFPLLISKPSKPLNAQVILLSEYKPKNKPIYNISTVKSRYFIQRKNTKLSLKTKLTLWYRGLLEQEKVLDSIYAWSGLCALLAVLFFVGILVLK